MRKDNKFSNTAMWTWLLAQSLVHNTGTYPIHRNMEVLGVNLLPIFLMLRSHNRYLTRPRIFSKYVEQNYRITNKFASNLTFLNLQPINYLQVKI
jgi:hypothetical protein